MKRTTRTPPALDLLPKRFLTTAEVCAIYRCSPEYLEGQPRHALPRNKRGGRSYLYDVRDLEAHFNGLRDADGAPIPEGVPALLYLPTPTRAA